MTSVPPAQRLSGPAVILQGPALLDVDQLGRIALRQLDRDKIPPPPRLLRLLRLVGDAAEEYRRFEHELRTSPPAEAESPHALPDQLTARQAAELIGITEQHCRRIADQIGGITGRRPLMFDREFVETYAAQRRDRKGRS